MVEPVAVAREGAGVQLRRSLVRVVSQIDRGGESSDLKATGEGSPDEGDGAGEGTNEGNGCAFEGRDAIRWGWGWYGHVSIRVLYARLVSRATLLKTKFRHKSQKPVSGRAFYNHTA